MKKLKTIICIPARYRSSRFPGKPLAKILGKPMIQWTAEISAKAVGKKNVFVATDSIKIEKAVLEIPLNVKSNLSEPEVAMSKLLRMKSGDTLNINLDETVEFYVENQKYFSAEMGEFKGNASVKLLKRLN